MDTTPKARKPSVTIREQELYAESKGSSRISSFSIDETPCKPRARRFSLAKKNFVSKNVAGGSVGGLNSGTETSFHTRNFFRRLSHHRRKRIGSSQGSMDTTGTTDSFEMQNLPRGKRDVGSDSYLSDGHLPSSPAHFPTPIPHSYPFVLSPSVTVTPEIESAENFCCSIWVGVEISGVLQSPDGTTDPNMAGLTLTSEMVQSYGCLYSMLIDLTPGEGCLIEELVGSLYDRVSLALGQTRLILVKVRLGNVSSLFQPAKSSPVALIAQLESHLGNIVTPYLTVRLTYKHSAFTPQNKYMDGMKTGILSQLTSLRTTTTAIVHRHDPMSTWIPQSSRSFDRDPADNPLIKMVENYLPNEDAVEAIHRLSSHESHYRNSVQSPSVFAAELAKPTNAGYGRSFINNRYGSSTSSADTKADTSPTSMSSHGDFQDPARKIWAEMRKSSRITSSSYQRNLFNLDRDAGYPSPAGSVSPFVEDVEGLEKMYSRENQFPVTLDIQQERDKIKQVALRNKRSIGADTLKSIAPSVVPHSNGKKGLGGLGLGIGISSGKIWGLGMPWW